MNTMGGSASRVRLEGRLFLPAAFPDGQEFLADVLVFDQVADQAEELGFFFSAHPIEVAQVGQGRLQQFGVILAGEIGSGVAGEQPIQAHSRFLRDLDQGFPIRLAAVEIAADRSLGGVEPDGELRLGLVLKAERFNPISQNAFSSLDLHSNG